MPPFDKASFLAELRTALAQMTRDGTTINDGQLRNTLIFAQDQGVLTQDPDTIMAMEGAPTALRTLYAYHTMAIALQDPRAWAAAVEVFPVESVPSQCADLLLTLLAHLEANPAPLQAALAEVIPDQLPVRLALLRNALLERLGGIA